MYSLAHGPVADTLARLFHEAEAADRNLTDELAGDPGSIDQAIGELIEAEKTDLRAVYRGMANHYLNVSPEFGRFLYLSARAANARLIVEFGTSMGVSAIHLAAALQDMGGDGRLIGTELEPTKVTRAIGNLRSAGLAGLAEIREGDALETLADLPAKVDMVHLDGAFTLYLPVLKLIEPQLRVGAMILAENAFEQAGDYLPYVRDSANGYASIKLPFADWRGNEMSVFLGTQGAPA